jgi:Baseplate J-like protein
VKVPLPNLDDRRWFDLVDEGRSLIPVYAPDWTDHNVHDPGITLIELFAWIAEMDIYELNRITDEHKRKFLELVGIKVNPPRAARTVLSFTLKEGSAPRRLKPNTELSCSDPLGDETRFRLLEPVTIADSELAVIQVKDAMGFHDLTPRRQRGEPLALFGDMAERGIEFYLGFTKPFRTLRPVRLYFKFAGANSDRDHRMRLTAEQREQAKPCAHASDCSDLDFESTISEDCEHMSEVPALNRVRLVWEIFAEVKGKQRWLALDPKRRQIEDGTRCLTLDGEVILRAPAKMAPQQLGQSHTPLFYARCRFEAGAYDAPPVAGKIIMNAARAEQAVPATATLIIEPKVISQGSEPKPGDIVGLAVTLDEHGHITALKFEPPSDRMAGFRVLEFTAATQSRAGKLTIEAVRVGYGNGWPHQALELPFGPPQQSSFKLYTEESGTWRSWDRVDDFVDSGRRDAHFVLDHQNGKVLVGDGEHGRIAPKQARIFAAYRWTRAEKGNLASGTNFSIVDSPHNRTIVKSFDAIKVNVKSITNPLQAIGGAKAETIDHAIGRAIELMASTWRAVTLNDYEELAKKTPGARTARAAARANLHASFPCFRASGIVTVIILPDMPGPRPTPSRGLLRDVSTYLHGRRIVGTRVEVVAPRYLEVAVRARVKALSGSSKSTVQQKVIAALNEFFNPLNGGPDGTGWPFGRDVYRSEVLQVMDEVVGVDHVLKLDLIVEGCEPQCGNVCLGPTWLVAAGNHEIEII